MDEFDDEARRLLLPLGDATPPPTTLDVGSLVRAGRRRVRRRRLVGVGGVSAASVVVLVTSPLVLGGAGGPPRHHPDSLAATTVAASATPRAPARPLWVPTQCTGARLPLPDGATESQVLDGDPTGRYLVGVARGTRTNKVWTVLWDRGRMRVLTPPAGEPDNLAVNARGVVAGNGLRLFDGGNEQVGWVYRDGGYTRLAGPAGSTVVGIAGINRRGDVLGAVDSVDQATGPAPASPYESQLATRRPMVWAGGAGEARPLVAPAGLVGPTATAIDDDGTVVGFAMDGATLARLAPDESPGAASRAVAWDANGAGRQLPAPAGSAPGSSAIAIRDGWVVGYAGGPAELVRWNLRTGDVGPVPGLVWLGAANRQGWVAGFVRDGSGYETPAFVVGETVVRLPSVDGAVRTREGPGAFTISDEGTVLAGILVTGSDQAPVAVRWTCR